tara:strand:- start:1251 stop:1616 length:366 start_codon:yes stop_codon:yes gene_type:complete
MTDPTLIPVPTTPAPFGKSYALPAGWAPDALHVALWSDDNVAVALVGPLSMLQEALDAAVAVVAEGHYILINGKDEQGVEHDAFEPTATDTDAVQIRSRWEDEDADYRALCQAESAILYPY